MNEVRRYARRNEPYKRRPAGKDSYEKAMIAIEKDFYEKVRVAAENAYWKATAPAWKDYSEAKAAAKRASAWKAFEKAIAPTKKAYTEARVAARKRFGMQ